MPKINELIGEMHWSYWDDIRSRVDKGTYPAFTFMTYTPGIYRDSVNEEIKIHTGRSDGLVSFREIKGYLP